MAKYTVDSSLPYHMLLASLIPVVILVVSIQLKNEYYFNLGLLYSTLSLISLASIILLLIRAYRRRDIYEVRTVSPFELVYSYMVCFIALSVGAIVGSIIAMLACNISLLSALPITVGSGTKKFLKALVHISVGYSESGLIHISLPAFFAENPRYAIVVAVFANILFAILHLYVYPVKYAVISALLAGISVTLTNLYLAYNGVPSQQGVLLAHASWNIILTLLG